METNGIVFELYGKERIFNINSLEPESLYVLEFFDGRKKVLFGNDALEDLDFISVLRNTIIPDTSKVDFSGEGAIYTKGKENDIIGEISSLEWRRIEESKIYLPFQIERLLVHTIESRTFLKDASHYAYSSIFNPLHFFGLRETIKSSTFEKFFVSDNIFTTLILTITKGESADVL